MHVQHLLGVNVSRASLHPQHSKTHIHNSTGNTSCFLFIQERNGTPFPHHLLWRCEWFWMSLPMKSSKHHQRKYIWLVEKSFLFFPSLPHLPQSSTVPAVFIYHPRFERDDHEQIYLLDFSTPISFTRFRAKCLTGDSVVMATILIRCLCMNARFWRLMKSFWFTKREWKGRRRGLNGIVIVMSSKFSKYKIDCLEE